MHPSLSPVLGLNYHTRGVVSASGAWDVKTGGHALTDMGWEVYTEGLTQLLLRLHRDWPVPPMFVKENGPACKDQRVGSRVNDVARTDCTARHIAAVAQALHQGVSMAGYMVWSLLNKLEWASGYARRFGIVHVDHATQQRTLKNSALFYADFLRQQHAHHARLASLALVSRQVPQA